MPMYGLSIIIPTYNEADNINPLIRYIYEAIGNQIVEIIVVDTSESEDDIFLSIESPETIQLKCNTSSRSVQLDLGARRASHDVLYFLHADTFPPSTFYKDIMDSLADGNSFGMFSYCFDSPRKLLAINGRVTKKDGLFTGGGDQGLFIEKKTYLRTGGFNKELPIMEDFEYFWRLRRQGFQYIIIPHSALVSARKYENNPYMRTQLVNLATMLGFKIGISPLSLKKFYSRML